MTKKNTNYEYAFYSKPLKQVFDNLEDLKAAEAKHFAELKAKNEQAAAKKADAQKVEDAFKALNAARKAYKENLAQLTNEYSTAIAELKQAFELGKKDITEKLAAAEDAYNTALKEFTSKHDTFHLTLRDGDFETTISGSNKVQPKAKESVSDNELINLFNLLFGF